MSLKSVNPFNGELLGEYKEMSIGEISDILDRSNIQSSRWRNISFKERSGLMKNVAQILREQVDELAKIITNEMGKVFTEAKAEVEKCAWVCEYYAENAESFLKTDKVSESNLKAIVAYEPIGVVLAIMPWNFPFWQVFRFAAPTLMAGNVAVLKHASNVSGCSLAIEKIFADAGFPEGVFSSILLKGGDVEKVIVDDRVSAVTLTGSTLAGQSVAKVAGGSIKKTVLELGGSDPYVVLADADVKLAAVKCASGRLLNAGQSCIGAKRFIVVEDVYDEFVTEFVEVMQKANMGDPYNTTTSIGPLAAKRFQEEIDFQVQKSIQMGATALIGGFVTDGSGAFYPPTILTGVEKGMPAYSEELFGPVASVIKAKNQDEAINIANDTNFGLGAAIFSKNIEKARELATHKLEAGAVFINDFVKSDPRLPFGGIKKSGYGRELSVYGIREFVNIKTVVFS